MKTDTIMVGGVCIADHGEPADLDGASMQFTVTYGPYPLGATLAYFDTREDAEIFAKAKTRAMRKIARKDGR